MSTAISDTVRRWRGPAYAVLTGFALTSCFFNASRVPAIPADSRLDASPLPDGYYCVIEADSDLEDRLDEADCGQWRFDAVAKELIIEPDDPDERTGFALARLNRGVVLMQAYDEDFEGYYLVYAIMREGGAVFLPAIETHEADVLRAQALGVAVAEGDDLLSVEAGDAAAVLELFNDASGRRFDAALRDPQLADQIYSDSVYVVHMGDSLPDSLPKIREFKPVMDKLDWAIERAMTLE